MYNEDHLSLGTVKCLKQKYGVTNKQINNILRSVKYNNVIVWAMIYTTYIW